MGQFCLKLLLKRLGKLLVNVKNSKLLQKMWEQNQFGNNWEVEKRDPSVELLEPDSFLEKVDRKTVALAKTFLTKENECKPKSFSVRGFCKFFLGDF